MTRKEAIEILRDTPIDIRSAREDDIYSLYATAQNMALEALDQEPIIRCEECVHYEDSHYFCYRFSGRTVEFCSKGETFESYKKRMESDEQ